MKTQALAGLALLVSVLFPIGMPTAQAGSHETREAAPNHWKDYGHGDHGTYPASPHNKALYQIVFHMVLNVALDGIAVENARDLYSATAINLRVDWRDVEPSKGSFSWWKLEGAIDNVLNAGLKLFVRVNLNGKPNWAMPNDMGGTISSKRFMADQTGNVYVAPTDYACCTLSDRVVLSFADKEVRKILARSYRAILKHLKFYIERHHPGELRRLVVVTPVFNFYEESEYPLHHNGMLDYSSAAVEGFRRYLREKYHNDISLLNEEWGQDNVAGQMASFTTFSEIDPQRYNWHLPPGSPSILGDITRYDLFTGRRDWIHYRTTELKTFSDALYDIHRAEHIPFGIQLGSIHDELMEARGFYDVTPLIENADWLIVAPIVEQRANSGFEIQADYLRSVCTFWSTRRGRTVRFAEESNWRGYNNHTPSQLSEGWNQQIDTFKDRGASAHFIFGWDNSESWLLSTINTYSHFINHLTTVANTHVTVPKRTQGLHLSEAGMAANLGNLFPMLLPDQSFTYQVYNPVSLDLVTDFMLNNDGKSLNKYETIYLPKGSYYIAQRTLGSLLRKGLRPRLVNATHFVSGYGQFLITSGRARWLSRLNSDHYRLIWRTRSDAMRLWPRGNKADPEQADRAGISRELDFIEWLVETDATHPEYPDVKLTYQNWDPDVYAVWQRRTDLQSRFPDGFHAFGSSVYTPRASTLLDWVLRHGVREYPRELRRFRGYPFLSHVGKGD